MTQKTKNLVRQGWWSIFGMITLFLLLVATLTSCVKSDKLVKFNLSLTNVNGEEAKMLTEAASYAIATLQACDKFKKEYGENYELFQVEKNNVSVLVATSDELWHAQQVLKSFSPPNAYFDVRSKKIYFNYDYLWEATPFRLERTMAHELLHLANLEHITTYQEAEFYGLLWGCGYSND